jgi:hypothetical protein
LIPSSTHWVVPLAKDVPQIDKESRERQLREGVTTDGQRVAPLHAGSDIEKGSSSVKAEEAQIENSAIRY